MEPFDLLNVLARTMENLQLPYLVTGSMATIAYGEPRFTNDIDVVVDLSGDRVESFCAAFPEEDYYLSREAARDAVGDWWFQPLRRGACSRGSGQPSLIQRRTSANRQRWHWLDRRIGGGMRPAASQRSTVARPTPRSACSSARPITGP